MPSLGRLRMVHFAPLGGVQGLPNASTLREEKAPHLKHHGRPRVTSEPAIEDSMGEGNRSKLFGKVTMALAAAEMSRLELYNTMVSISGGD